MQSFPTSVSGAIPGHDHQPILSLIGTLNRIHEGDDVEAKKNMKWQLENLEKTLQHPHAERVLKILEENTPFEAIQELHKLADNIRSEMGQNIPQTQEKVFSFIEVSEIQKAA